MSDQPLTVKEALASPQSDAALEAQLLEDRLLFGDSFYVLVNGRKVRVPPDKVWIESETGSYRQSGGLEISAPRPVGKA